MMRRLPLPFLVLALTIGCADGSSDDGSTDASTVPADPVTQRQRDSAVGASGLPGAGGVSRALDASDAAAARAATLDSLSRQP